MRAYLIEPLWQALAMTGLMIVGLFVFRILGSPIWAWNGTAFVILLYCFVNAVIGVFVPFIGLYLLKSVGLLIALTIAAFALSTLISGMNYEQFGENAMVFAAPFLYYPVLLLIMGILRLFVKRS